MWQSTLGVQVTSWVNQEWPSVSQSRPTTMNYMISRAGLGGQYLTPYAFFAASIFRRVPNNQTGFASENATMKLIRQARHTMDDEKNALLFFSERGRLAPPANLR